MRIINCIVIATVLIIVGWNLLDVVNNEICRAKKAKSTQIEWIDSIGK
jgi:hypothetical protein